MMSQQPILVYGSQQAGVVDYAKRDGWAFVIDQRQIDLLTDALRKLIMDKDFSTKLIETAYNISLKNHDEEIVRKEFLKAIQSAIFESQV
jgi:hypothetical protein